MPHFFARKLLRSAFKLEFARFFVSESFISEFSKKIKEKLNNIRDKFQDEHCVKSVQIQSFFWSVFSHIQTEYGGLRSKSD